MARIVIVGGGCRGRRLAEGLRVDGHAVRITTRSEAGREAIEECGAECWIGTPDRLATLRGALDGVAVACWLLGCASGTDVELDALHGSRLELFMTQAIDTTVRGVVYEASGSAGGDRLARGVRTVDAIATRNAIPLAILGADPRLADAWLGEARGAIAALLGEA